MTRLHFTIKLTFFTFLVIILVIIQQNSAFFIQLNQKVIKYRKFITLNNKNAGIEPNMRIKLFEHNQDDLDSVLKLLSETGKAAVIHPAGTGKSYIGTRFVSFFRRTNQNLF